MRWISILGAIVLSSSAALAQCDLTTLFNANNKGSDGGAIYFDLVVNQEATITGVDVNTAASGRSIGLTMYVIGGSYVGNAGSSAGWMQVGIDDGNGVGQGVDSPSTITFARPVVLQAGTYGVALVGSGNGQDMNHEYTNGSGSNEIHSNAVYTLTAGAADNTPFSGGRYAPRVWNGRIRCSTGGGGGGGSTCLAQYDFETSWNPFRSVDGAACSKASPLSSRRGSTEWQVVTEGNTQAIMIGTGWRPANQNDYDYNRNRISFSVDPDASQRTLLSIDSLCFTTWRNKCTFFNYLDVRVDEDPGPGGDNFQSVVATLALTPAVNRSYQQETFCVDLSQVAILQNVSTEISVRLHLYGQPAYSCLDVFCLDDICLNGSEFKCPPARLVDLGPGCRGDLVRLDGTLPAIGTNFDLTMTTPFPNAPVYFLFSYLRLNPPLPVPGTECVLYFNPLDGFYGPVGSTDANGNWSWSIPIANDPLITGAEFVIQNMVWLASGDLVSNGILGITGCL